jgi:hypothetical protein
LTFQIIKRGRPLFPVSTQTGNDAVATGRYNRNEHNATAAETRDQQVANVHQTTVVTEAAAVDNVIHVGATQFRERGHHLLIL